MTNSNIRKIRYRSGTSVVTLPPKIVKFLKLSIKPPKNYYDHPLVVDSKGKHAYVLIWINKNWNIEFGPTSFHTENVNGILLLQELYPHGGSIEMGISHEIVKTLDSVKPGWAESFEVFVNKQKNIEFKLL